MDEQNQNLPPSAPPVAPGAPPPVATPLEPQPPGGPAQMADLTTLTIWMIVCVIVTYGFSIISQAISLSRFVVPQILEMGAKPAPVHVGFQFFGSAGACIAAPASIAAAVLWFIWLYKSAKNLTFLPEGGYPYSAGLTFGLMFVPLFNIYWLWRVLTQEADALLRARAARSMHPGNLPRVRPLMIGYLIGIVVAFVVAIGMMVMLLSTAISQAIRAGEAMNPEEFIPGFMTYGLIFGAVMFIVNTAVTICQYLSIWYITVAMRDIKQSG